MVSLAPMRVSQMAGAGTAPARTDQISGSAAFGAVLANRFKATLDKAFQDAGSKYNLDPALLKAIADAESSFNPNAASGQGAIGLMQIMPDTAQSLGVDPRDPVQSILGAAQYLRTLIDDFQGNPRLAIAAYNAGPGAVRKYNGIPPYKETQDYVQRVTDLVKKYQIQGSGQDQGSDGASAPVATNLPQDANTMAEMLLMLTQFELYYALSKLE